MKKKYLLAFLVLFTLTGCEASRYKTYDDKKYTILSTSQQDPYVELENVKKINVDWIDGVVYFKSSSEVENICIYEDFYDYKPVKSEYARYSNINGTLDIKFYKSNISVIDDISKDLYILVPQAYTLDNVYVNSVSSNINITDINIEKLSIAQVSGNNVIKGNINDISIKSVSSNSDIYLDEYTAFEAKYETVSGNFNCDFAITSKDNIYSSIVTSDHPNHINCLTTSGNLNIKKYE